QTVAAESFGESLERFAREPLQFRSSTLGELIEKARLCFRVLSTEGEQLERFKEDRFKIEKKRVSAYQREKIKKAGASRPFLLRRDSVEAVGNTESKASASVTFAQEMGADQIKLPATIEMIA